MTILINTNDSLNHNFYLFRWKGKKGRKEGEWEERREGDNGRGEGTGSEEPKDMVQ